MAQPSLVGLAHHLCGDRARRRSHFAYRAVLVLLAGFLGCQMDSVLGAVLENRGLMTKGTVNAASILCGSLAVALMLGFP